MKDGFGKGFDLPSKRKLLPIKEMFYHRCKIRAACFTVMVTAPKSSSTLP